jgi:hypothetical protein
VLESWLASPFGDRLVNRRSASWRGLTELEKSAQGEALKVLILPQPTPA